MKNGIIIPLSEEEVRKLIKECIREELQTQTNAEFLEDEILKMDQVMTLLRISKPTIYDYINKGILTSHKIGSRRFFLRSEIIASMKQRRLKDL